MIISELYTLIDREIAPFALAAEWDNSGLLAGDPQAPVTAALICLDITLPAIRQAQENGAQLIISHHPVIFHPLKNVLAGSPAYALIEAGIAAICAHTNLDLARGGVNDCLAKAIGLQDIRPLEEGVPESLGRVGELPAPLSAEAFAAHVRERLHPAGGVRFADGGRPTRRVAVCGGAGSDLWEGLPAGVDALLSSEFRHHEFLACQAAGITAVDAGHFGTERVVLGPLCARLTALAPQVRFILAQDEGPVRCC